MKNLYAGAPEIVDVMEAALDWYIESQGSAYSLEKAPQWVKDATTLRRLRSKLLQREWP